MIQDEIPLLKAYQERLYSLWIGETDVIQDEIPPQKTSIDAGWRVMGRARRDDTRRDTPAKGLPGATLQPMDRGMIQDGIDSSGNLPYAFKKDQ